PSCHNTCGCSLASAVHLGVGVAWGTDCAMRNRWSEPHRLSVELAGPGTRGLSIVRPLPNVLSTWAPLFEEIPQNSDLQILFAHDALQPVVLPLQFLETLLYIGRRWSLLSSQGPLEGRFAFLPVLADPSAHHAGINLIASRHLFVDANLQGFSDDTQFELWGVLFLRSHGSISLLTHDSTPLSNCVQI